MEKSYKLLIVVELLMSLNSCIWLAVAVGAVGALWSRKSR